MDTIRERREIRIFSTNDYSRVIGLMTMKFFEMQPIVRQNSTTGFGGKRKNLSIRYLLISCPRFQ